MKRMILCRLFTMLLANAAVVAIAWSENGHFPVTVAAIGFGIVVSMLAVMAPPT